MGDKKSTLNHIRFIILYLILFPKGEFLRTHRVGPLGLSGSLFLGLLVFDFYHPTNRELYLVAVAVAVGRMFGWPLFSLVYWFWIFTTLRTVTFIPQRRVP